MLIESQEERFQNIKKPISFVCGEVELALTQYGMWKFTQSIKDTDIILQRKRFSFGKNVGVIKHTDSGNTYLKIKNESWYLVTLNKGTVPMLKNSNPKCPDKIHPKYRELTEIK